MKKIIIFLVFICVVSCKQNEPAVSKATKEEKINIQQKAERKFTTNSDGSKTYLSGRIICKSRLPIFTKTSDCYADESKIHFYAEGRGFDFAGLDIESLVIDKLIINNIDKKQTSNFESNVILDVHPKINAERNYVSWGIRIEEGYNSVKDDVSISGHITAFKSKDLREFTSDSFDINNFDSFKVGDIFIKGSKNSQDFPEYYANSHLTEFEIKRVKEVINKIESYERTLTDEEISSALKELGINNDEQAKVFTQVIHYVLDDQSHNDESLVVKGNLLAIEKLEIFDDSGKISDSYSSSHSIFPNDNYYRYSFKTKPSSKIKIKISYWDNLKPIKLNFDF